eukprot:CAMPEP_0194507714 /NCGR_PEP_ID=MMETSP0253-20130528/37239_1 /TAXON_ID=2966 /ORGANISM="Noctiluca scintillans" /LENGTH=55 /DNA_ID=CAMNT_0039350641 /DNA_START=12 /DNA_END=179 /DNA_ORIENTATION=+
MSRVRDEKRPEHVTWTAQEARGETLQLVTGASPLGYLTCFQPSRWESRVRVLPRP